MTKQSGLLRRVLGASAALLSLSLAVGAAIAPAAATQVGVAAAVNPDAFSSLAGKPQSQLNIGKSIFFNERIKTTDSGLVQVLLVDGSTFTVGPDSDLVIDKFVYDANSATGQIAASFSKGVMRFVGGKISKSDNAVKIDTPAGAMAVRGCIVLAQVKGLDIAAILVFGDHLKLKNFVVYEPGNGVFLSANGSGEVKKAPAALISGLMAGLSNNQGNNNNAANKPSNPGSTAQLINTASLNELIQNANTQEIITAASEVKPVDSQPVSQETFQGGYAAGVYDQRPIAGDESPVGVVLSAAPTPVSFAGSPPQFQGATFTLFAEEGGGAEIQFSPVSIPQNPVLGINQSVNESGNTLPENPYGQLFVGAAGYKDIKVYHETSDTDPPELLDPAEVNPSSAALLVGVDGATDVLCSNCEFLKWGLWGATLRFSDQSEGTTSVTALGFWVAGDVVKDVTGALPTQGGADYYGKALGMVTTNLFSEQFTSHPAQGDMHMNWNFAGRNGTFNVSNFDTNSNMPGGVNFGGDLAMPGRPTGAPNRLSGNLTGSLPNNLNAYDYNSGLNGKVVGSFVKGGGQANGAVPAGVIGNWGIGNDRYKASGIFAGSHQVPD